MLRFVCIFLAFCSFVEGTTPVVLITGASEGLGLATAEYLADQGYRVYGTIREHETQPSCLKVRFEVMDVTNSSMIEDVVNRIIDKEGGLDVLINNECCCLGGALETLTMDEIKESMDVNFFGAIRMCQSVLPQMRKQKHGHIINISSVQGVFGSPFGSIYSSSKASLEVVSEALSIELKPWNIKVSIVEHGYVSGPYKVNNGSRKVDGLPYQQIHQELEEFQREKKGYQKYQTPKEIARILCKVIQDRKPSLRYQTSSCNEETVYMKLRDLSGFAYSCYYNEWLATYFHFWRSDHHLLNPPDSDWVDFP